MKIMREDPQDDAEVEPTRDFAFVFGWLVAWLLVAVSLVWLAGSVKL